MFYLPEMASELLANDMGEQLFAYEVPDPFLSNLDPPHSRQLTRLLNHTPLDVLKHAIFKPWRVGQSSEPKLGSTPSIKLL